MFHDYCRISLWLQYPWDLSHWHPSWRSCPSRPKTMARRNVSSSKHLMTTCSHPTSRRSWWGRILLMGSTRSKGAITAPSSRGHSRWIKFCLKLHNFLSKSYWFSLTLYLNEGVFCPVEVVQRWRAKRSLAAQQWWFVCVSGSN